jgi:hypothetical protein
LNALTRLLKGQPLLMDAPESTGLSNQETFTLLYIQSKGVLILPK